MSRKSYKGNVLLEVKSYFAQSCMSQEFFLWYNKWGFLL